MLIILPLCVINNKTLTQVTQNVIWYSQIVLQLIWKTQGWNKRGILGWSKSIYVGDVLVECQPGELGTQIAILIKFHVYLCVWCFSGMSACKARDPDCNPDQVPCLFVCVMFYWNVSLQSSAYDLFSSIHWFHTCITVVAVYPIPI